MKNKLQLLLFLLLNISTFSQCLSGDCNNGYGKYKLSDGSIYTGDFINYQFQGKGTISYISGNTYTGDWYNDKMNGKGIFLFSDGNRYEGDFVNSIQNGNGTFFYKNGDIYSGYWVSGTKTGKGSQTFAIGGRYDGDWVNNTRQGKGNNLYPDGSAYEGDWVNNTRQGYGAYFDKKEVVLYEGEWVADTFTGNGKKTYSNGAVEEGNWNNGALVSSFKINSEPITQKEDNNEAVASNSSNNNSMNYAVNAALKYVDDYNKQPKSSKSNSNVKRKCSCCNQIFLIKNGWGSKDYTPFYFGDSKMNADDIFNASIYASLGAKPTIHESIKFCSKRCAIKCGN
jgi:hypothetical protein